MNATVRFTNAITAARTATVDYSPGPLQLGYGIFNLGTNAWTVTGNPINLAATNAIPTMTVTGSVYVGNSLSGAQGLQKAGAGTLYLTGTNSYSPFTLISAGVLIIGNAGLSGTLGSGVVTNFGTLNIQRSNDLTVANNIVGTGTLNINGFGAGNGTGYTNFGPNSITTISGTNNFGGNVNVNSGTVRIVHSLAFGTSNKTIALSAGTAGNPILLLDGASGSIDLPASLTFQLSNARGTITNMAGDNVIRGPVRLTSGGGSSMIKIQSGTLLLTNSITFIDPNRALFLGGVSTGTILGSILSGTNTWIEKEDAGTWVIANTNTYPGVTQVRGGTLQVGNGGTSGNLSTNAVALTNNPSLVFNRSDSYAFPNVILGTGTLRKVGAGTMTMSAVSPVAGTMEVSVGRLDVTGKLTNSVITVRPGTVLGGNGGLGAVSAFGSVMPGVVLGTLTATNVTLQTNSTLEIEAANFAQAAGTGFDQLSVPGDLTISATAGNPSIIDFKTLSGTVPGYAANFDAFAGLTVRVANVTGLLTGYAADQLVLVTTNFLNAYVGSWTTVVSGSSLDLVYAPALTLGANALIWDGTNGTAALEEGSGTWSTGGANWWDGAAETTWNQSTATFGAGGSGSYTVNVAAAGVQAAGLAFVAGGSYEIAGPGSISLPADGVVTADVDGIVSASLSGTRLAKVGAGKLTLAGDANGFSAISINAGTVQVGAGGAAGTIAATITNNGALIFDRSGTFTNIGVISGTGSLTKSGSGLVTLAANSSGFSGPVTVNGGELRLGAVRAQGTGAVTINAGGQLNLNGVVQTGLTNSYTIAGAGPDGSGALVSTNATVNQNSSVGFLTLSADATVGALGPGTSSAGRFDIAYNNGWVQGNHFTLTKAGNSQIAIRGPSSNLQIVANAGIIYGEDNDFALGTNAVVNAGGKLGGYNGRTFALPVTLNGGQLVSVGGTVGQTWTGPINVATDSVVSTAAGAGYAEQSIALTGEVSGPGKLTKEGTSSLFLTGTLAHAGSGELRLTRGNLYFSKPAGVAAWSGPITITNIGGDAVLRHTASDQIPDTTVVRFGRNPASGYPHWELLGNSETIGGLDAALDGVVQNAAFVAGIYPESVLTISNTANYSFSGFIRNSSGTMQTGSLRVVKTGPGTQVFASGNVTYTGTTTIVQGTLVLSNTTAFASPIQNDGTLIVDAPTAAMIYGIRTLAGTGALIKIGASTLRMDGTNTYTGGTFLHAGYIDAYGNGSIPSNSYLSCVSPQGLVLYQGATQWIGTLVGTNTGGNILGNTANRTGEVVIVGSGSNTYLGRIYQSAGPVRFRMAGSGTQVLGGTVDNTNARMMVDAGTLVLAKSSTPAIHAAAISIEMNGGTLVMGGTGDDQIVDTTDAFLTGGTIDLNGRYEAWDEVTGVAGTILNSAVATTGTVALGANGGSFTSSVTFADGAGTLAVSKLGAGVWVMANGNTHSGGGYVSNGTLRAANGSGLVSGSGTTIVETLGTADGTGTFGPLLVRNNGILSPGVASLGTLTSAGLTLGNAGRLVVDIMDFSGTAGATNGWDLVNVSGALTASASGATPFVIALRSVLPSGAAGAAANFTDTGTYTVKVATVSGSISGVGAGNVIVDATGLLNPQSGYWKVQVTGTDLEVVYGQGVVDTDPVSAWTNALTVSFCGYDRSEPLTNFPALIVLSKYDARGSNMYSVLSDTSAGSDLRFATTDAVPSFLNYEIEKWNPSGDSYVWVQIPLLTPGLQIEIRGGNPNATSAPPTYAINGSVWSNNGYLSVWHFNGGIAVDSAGTNDGVRLGTGSLAGNSILGDAASFNGANQYIDLPDQVFDFSTGLTVEAWARPAAAASYARIIDFGNGPAMTNILLSRNGTSANITFEHYASQAGTETLTTGNTPIPAIGSWGYWTASQSAGLSNNAICRLYMNGSERAVSTNFSTPPVVLRTSNFVGKSNWAADSLFNGLIDELRLSTVERSSNWIYATYLNVAAPQAFVCIAGQSKVRCWDANVVSAGRQDGDGTWNLSNSLWQDAFATNLAWANGVQAVLGSGMPSAGTNVITLADNVLIAGITVTAGPSYRIDGPAVHLFTLPGATHAIQTNLEIRSMLTGYGFTKTGGGILWLDPTNGVANNYTGTITVAEGQLWIGGTVGDGTIRGDISASPGTTVRLTTADRIMNNAKITVDEGAVLDLNGLSDAIGAFAGGGRVTNNNVNVLLDDQSRNGVLTGNIDIGTGGLYIRALSGQGLQTFGGTNRFGSINIERAGANLRLDGGSNVVTGSIGIGQQADGGSLTLNATTLNVSGNLLLGEQVSRHGEFYQTNSALTVGGHVRIGHWSTETSIWVMTSGSITMTSEPIVNNPFGASGTETNGAFYIGIDGNGVFRQYGGVLKAPAIVVDNRGDTAGPDVLQTEGGVINLGRWGIQGNASTLIMFGGSELQAYQSWTSTLPAQLTGTNGSLTVSPSTNVIAFNGALTGIGGLNINGTTGSGAVLLGGNSGFTGPTIVSNGYLFVNAAATATPITVGTAGGLGGSGAIGTATVAGVLSPGFLTGRLNTRDVTMLENSRVIVHVNNFAGTAGGANNGWDLLAVTNTLTLGGTVLNPLVFDLTSLAGTAAGAALNFNPLQVYTLQVANVSGSLVGFDATTVSLVTTNFLNAYVGTWNIQTNGQAIELVYAPAFTPSLAATLLWDADLATASQQDGAGTWDNTNTNWWDNGLALNTNWNGGLAYFGLGGGSGPMTVSIAAPGTLAAGLQFETGPSYTIAGPGSLGLLGPTGIVANTDVTISANLSGSNLYKKGAGTLTLLGDATAFSAVRVDEGTLRVGAGGTVGGILGSLNITNAGTLAFNRSDAVTQSGIISGAGSLEQDGPGVLTVSGVNTYQGNTYITGGTFKMGNQRALGDASAGTFISSGGTLDMNGFTAGTNFGSEVITVAGAGVGGAGAIYNSGAQANNMLRYLVLTGETAVGGTGRIDLDGTNALGSAYLQGDTNTLNKVGANIFAIRSGVAVTVGVVNVLGGTLSMEAGSVWNNEYPLNLYTGALFYAYNWTQTMGRVINLYGGTLQSLAGTLNITSTINAVSNGSVLYVNNSALNHTGVIAGAGSVLVNADNTARILTLAGTDANTATGELVLYNGITRFSKPAGVNAWGGNLITLSNNPGANVTLELRASEQIPDTAVLRFVRNGTTWPYLKTFGFSETVAGLDNPGTGQGVIEVVEGEASPGFDSTLTVNNALDYTFAGFLRDRAGGTSTNRLHLRKLGAGRQTLAGGFIGNGIWAGTVAVDAGTLTFSNCTVGTTFQPVITNNAVVEFTGLTSGNVGLQRPLLGGGGSYLMSGQNQFFGASESTGTIEIVSGRLFNDGRGGIWTNSSADVIVHTGAVWDMRATMLQADVLLGTGTVLNSFYALPGAFTNCLILGVANGSGTFFGSIVGNVAVDAQSNGLINVIKVGTGTQTFAGVNAYGGFTAVSNGTLVVDGSLGTGSVTVAASAKLGGSGTISGIVAAAGTVAPGSSAGRLTLAGLTLASSATIAIEVNGATQATGYDHLVVNSSVALNGSLAVSISTSYTPAAGSVYTVMTANALSGSFLNVTNGGDIVVGVTTMKVHYGIGSLFNANEVVLTTVAPPNPDSDGDGILDQWEMDNFGNLTAANATSQSDADGVSDFAEFIAGTDPNSSTSYLRFTNEVRSVSGQILYWPSVTGRLYDVDSSTNILQPGAWVTIATNLPSTAPQNVYTSPVPVNVQLYRIKVRIAP